MVRACSCSSSCRRAPFEGRPMSLIEQAAKRLEELRRAGVDVPDVSSAPAVGEPPGTIEAATANLQAASAAQPKKQRTALGAVPPAPRSTVPRPQGDSRFVHLDLAHLAAKGIVTPDAP